MRRHQVSRPTQHLAALALVVNAVNMTVLIPAARHEHAGWFTQSLPVVLTGLVLVLLFAAARFRRWSRK